MSCFGSGLPAAQHSFARLSSLPIYCLGLLSATTRMELDAEEDQIARHQSDHSVEPQPITDAAGEGP